MLVTSSISLTNATSVKDSSIMVTFTPSLPATVSATTVFYTTSSRPELLTSKTQSSSVAVIPPGTFVRFVISVPLNESVSDKANLTRGILTVYENGSLDGITGNVSVNVSERKKNTFCSLLGHFCGHFPLRFCYIILLKNKE